jgi:hypothetical protein
MSDVADAVPLSVATAMADSAARGRHFARV